MKQSISTTTASRSSGAPESNRSRPRYDRDMAGTDARVDEASHLADEGYEAFKSGNAEALAPSTSGASTSRARPRIQSRPSGRRERQPRRGRSAHAHVLPGNRG